MKSLVVLLGLIAVAVSVAVVTKHLGMAPEWVCETTEAGWQPRDSQGELVYDNHLWILGGWYSPQEPNPRDVWKSLDGRKWTRVVEIAPWEHSDLSAVVVFDGKMWLMGGRKLPSNECSNQVWSSTDGVDWKLETNCAGWCPRVAASFTVFKDKVWILGGTGDFYDHSEAMVKNDVWSSVDGVVWELMTPDADWPKRAHAQAVVFDDKIWIMGGGAWHPQHVPLNDVWCSEDGVNWALVTEAAPWKPRLWFSLVVYRDRMWVLGGWSKENGNFGDVWYTKDGKNWEELSSETIWSRRHEHSAWVFRDRIWVAGGYADSLNNEVWSLDVARTWFKEQ